MDLKTEQKLEKKYTDVLIHNSLKGVLSGYGVTARSVGSAIKAYCNAEDVVVPDNFCDAEVFANDVFDHWEEARPGYHENLQYETTIEGIKRYLAFKFIWKAKVQSNTTIMPTLQIQASNTLVIKGAIGGAMMAAHKHTKSDPRLRPGELAEAVEMAFQAFIPIVHKLQIKGEFDDKRIDQIATKIVKYIESEEFKQIEFKGVKTDGDDEDAA